jgi:hypothetical protein
MNMRLKFSVLMFSLCSCAQRDLSNQINLCEKIYDVSYGNLANYNENSTYTFCGKYGDDYTKGYIKIVGSELCEKFVRDDLILKNSADFQSEAHGVIFLLKEKKLNVNKIKNSKLVIFQGKVKRQTVETYGIKKPKFDIHRSHSIPIYIYENAVIIKNTSVYYTGC